MLKSLLLILSLFAFTSFANPFDQQLKPESINTNITTPGTKFNFLDSPVSDIVWCSEKKNVIFLLCENFALYRSVNGSEFEKLGKNELIGASSPSYYSYPKYPYYKGPVAKIIQSPVDENMMIFLGTEDRSWITTDCGASFKVLDQGRRVDDILFHPTEKTWLLASAWTLCEDFGAESCKKYKELFVTKDFGDNWEIIASYVSQFSWAQINRSPFPAIPNERVIIVHEPKGQGDQQINGWSDKFQVSYSDNFFKTSVLLVKRGNMFLITNDFILVVQVERHYPDKITLLVGNSAMTDYDLRPIEIPGKRFMVDRYNVFETTAHAVFLHISDPDGKYKYGNLYVSDSTGLRYSLSLNGNVLNPLNLADFDEVKGLEGIYLGNVYNKDTLQKFKGLNKLSLEDSKKTMISFNFGGIWQPLTPPETDLEGNKTVCSSEQECSLHLCIVYNKNFGPLYTPKNSIGLVLGTGNIGAHLSTKANDISTYLSRDGGLTWFEIAKGSHIYEVSGHGSLLLMAPNAKPTLKILYSWNQGLTWEKLKFSDVAIEIENIVVDPSSTGQKFLIYGYRSRYDKIGVVIAVDFTPLQQKLCKGLEQPDTPDSDYETWTPSGKISRQCLMGRQVIYTRRKRESECFNSEPHEQWKTIKTCECTEEDWQCDYGFMRAQDGSCIPIGDEFNMTMIPPKECTDFYKVTSGYRRIEGNTCDGGVNHEPLRLPCPEIEIGVGTFNSRSLIILLSFISVALGLLWMINGRLQNADAEDNSYLLVSISMISP